MLDSIFLLTLCMLFGLFYRETQFSVLPRIMFALIYCALDKGQSIERLASNVSRPGASNGINMGVGLVPLGLLALSTVHPTPLLRHLVDCSADLASSTAICMFLLSFVQILRAGHKISKSMALLAIVMSMLTWAMPLKLKAIPHVLLSTCLLGCMPRTFTIGEAMFVSQLAVAAGIFLWDGLRLLPVHQYCIVVPIFSAIVAIVLSKCLHMLLPFAFYTCLPGVLLTAFPITLSTILKTGPIPCETVFSWISQQFHQTTTIFMLSIWAVVLLITAVVTSFYCNHRPSSKSRFSGNLMRKFYHVAAIAMFVPGAFLNLHLLQACLAVALSGFLVLEALRVLNTQMIAPLLDRFMNQFRNDLDSGSAILSHTYLLCGCALPIWLEPAKRPTILAFSGLISLGLGDAVAAVAGMSFGTRRWPVSHKTIEGSICSALAMAIATAWLSSYTSPELAVAHRMLLAGMALPIAAWEGLSDQNDNLTLPIVSYIFFSMARRMTR